MKIHEKPVDVIDDNGVRAKVDLIGLFFKIICSLVITGLIILDVMLFLE